MVLAKYNSTFIIKIVVMIIIIVQCCHILFHYGYPEREKFKSVTFILPRSFNNFCGAGVHPRSAGQKTFSKTKFLVQNSNKSIWDS